MNIIERIDRRYLGETVSQHLTYPVEVGIKISGKSVKAAADLIDRTDNLKFLKTWYKEEMEGKGRVTLLKILDNKIRQLEGGMYG